MLIQLFNIVFIVLAVRLFILIQTLFQRRESLKREARKENDVPIKTLVVLGSGGHTTEMLQLLQKMDPKLYSPLLYVVASTDDTSERRVKAFGGRAADETFHIPRSREVGQSYLTSIGTTIWAFVFSLQLVYKVRPDLLLCNGPGTCLPVAVATMLYRILGLCEGNIVFVESFCRVERYVRTEEHWLVHDACLSCLGVVILTLTLSLTHSHTHSHHPLFSLSLTGKLLYPCADMFVVHWDELHEKFPRSVTASSFVPNKRTTQSQHMAGAQ